jgi:hypothetical protein
MSAADPSAPRTAFVFPPTDLTFDGIANPKERHAAFEIQEQLRFRKDQDGPEFIKVVDLMNHSTLVSDGKGHLSLAGHHAKTSLADSIADKASGLAAEELLKTGVELVTPEVAPAVSPFMQLAEILTAERVEKRMIGNSPEDKRWREQQTIRLVAEQMAPQARRDRREYNTTDIDQRDRLVNNYNTITSLLKAHYHNMTRSGNQR